MKIAVFGDVHGNLTAFEAVIADIERWNPDLVISTGDIVNRGPSSGACLTALLDKKQSQGWRTLLGNHEEYVIHQSTPGAARTGPEVDSYYQSYWTFQNIGRNVEVFKDWENVVDVEGPGHSTVRVAHGSVLGNDAGIFPGQADNDLVKRGGVPAPAVFCGGHTHAAFQRTVNGTLFVNAGSVGIPFDGDWRAGYARLVHVGDAWAGEIIRLAYERERTFAEYRDSGFLSEAGPIAWLVLAEYIHAKSQLFAWHRDYYDLVEAGEIEIERAVREQLERQGMWESVAPYLN